MKVIQEPGKALVKAWVEGVPIEEEVWQQTRNIASFPFVKGIVVLADSHVGKAGPVGACIATEGALICGLTGVDLGCGVLATKTSLKAHQLPDNLDPLRFVIEASIPHGRTDNGGRNDRGAWGNAPNIVLDTWSELYEEFDKLTENYPKLKSFPGRINQLGTLGQGNHAWSLNIDHATNDVWLLLHSGSRGIGNSIGTHFIKTAEQLMKQYFIELPDNQLGYLPEGTKEFNDYIKLVHWAQRYAFVNREIMMKNAIDAINKSGLVPPFEANLTIVNCHHNYIASEKHYGKKMWITRKGAIRAGEGEYGVILGTMAGESHIVIGKGNRESFMTCSHGAGRAMSRTKARATFTLEDHIKATEGVSCRKDLEVIDETPMAYKDLKAVMAAQTDLVDIVHTIKEILTIKG